jgi:hypothetical protein
MFIAAWDKSRVPKKEPSASLDPEKSGMGKAEGKASTRSTCAKNKMADLQGCLTGPSHDREDELKNPARAVACERTLQAGLLA